MQPAFQIVWNSILHLFAPHYFFWLPEQFSPNLPCLRFVWYSYCCCCHRGIHQELAAEVFPASTWWLSRWIQESTPTWISSREVEQLQCRKWVRHRYQWPFDVETVLRVSGYVQVMTNNLNIDSCHLNICQNGSKLNSHSLLLHFHEWFFCMWEGQTWLTG